MTMFSAGDTGSRLGRIGSNSLARIPGEMPGFLLGTGGWHYNVFWTTEGWRGCGTADFLGPVVSGFETIKSIPILDGITPLWFSSGHHFFSVIRNDGTVIYLHKDNSNYTEYPMPVSVHYVSSGKHNAVFLPDSTGIYYTTRYSDPPKFVGDGIQFIDVAAGWFPSSDSNCHFVALSANGDVYTWGIGSACGHGNDFNDFTPKIVTLSVPIAKVFAFSENSYLLDSENRIWSCGKNEYGQNGLGDTNKRSTFHRVDPFIQDDDDEIVWIDGGNGTSYVLTRNHHIYSAGDGDYRMLMQGDGNKRTRFEKCQQVSDRHVSMVVPGLFHVVICCNYEGVWFWRGESLIQPRKRQLVLYE